jgi:hypothetical protein
MPDEAKSSPREFLVVAVPDRAEPGTTLKLLGIAETQAAAEKLVGGLDPGTLGKVAVLERKGLFMRKPAVETLEVPESISKK